MDANKSSDRKRGEINSPARSVGHVLSIKLADVEGEVLLTRSQAKRILTHIDTLNDVVLDFHGVLSIGPAFADEVFRVFATRRPEVDLLPANANEDVRRMILRAKATASVY